MKKLKRVLAAAMLLMALAVSFSCRKQVNEDTAEGRLMFRFDSSPEDISKVSKELPDTNEFLITVTDENGKEVFDGIYGELPEAISVDPGSYSIYVRSEDFSGLKFSAPQYGDEQCVVVPPSGDIAVSLDCRQINSGIRLDISPDFLTEYPDGVLFLKSGTHRLMYSYSEDRIAYFSPGSISLILYDGGRETVLLTRTVVAQEILVMKISVSASDPEGSRGISISLDTSRVWTMEDYYLGSQESSKGESSGSAISVAQAAENVGRDDVWVSGFIVGGDLTSANASFEPPFKSASNILLGPRSTVSSRNSCIAVQLPSGDVRDALNLALNPEMLGRLVCLKGDIESSYYGLVGLKNVSDFVLK